MRALRVMGGVAATTLAVLGSLSAAPSAQGQDFGVSISGTWEVYSDGEWARMNEVKFKQLPVRETWTVNVSCVSPIECTGEATSSLGWTGTVRLRDYWFIEHDVPNWMPCPNGTFATGHQKFIMWGVDRTNEERLIKDYTYMAGRNVTKSDSGACGVNNPKVIELPVSAQKVA
ncbi:hypothetical protein [Mycolicibacterium hippocampi]|uniref:Secreted protein n=1 Tax=Mycolicibacterium hippocampi TaxID=659824 RepID=A0A850PEI5_9MYCO|nr:hypothetical protein [Mycolicibacterium hippocampi]NVN48588.1 hypothetical protein [Mycolicibacterium hippocampi]